MSISVPTIKQILIEKDVHFLYHANTVETSVTFLTQGGLMSRGAVETNCLHQSPQGSDDIDKQLGVYYDIFLDSDDIHTRAHNLNAYGPVTFVYSLDVLEALQNMTVKVTKDNPIRWTSTMPEYNKYFTDPVEMRHEYKKGFFQQHLTICNMREPLQFHPYLEKIIIDDPNISNRKYFDNAVATLEDLLQQNNLFAHLEVRQCPSICKCQIGYQSKKEAFIYYKFKVH